MVNLIKTFRMHVTSHAAIKTEASLANYTIRALLNSSELRYDGNTPHVHCKSTLSMLGSSAVI